MSFKIIQNMNKNNLKMPLMPFNLYVLEMIYSCLWILFLIEEYIMNISLDIDREIIYRKQTI